jgi:hypothetical protein
MGFGRDYTEKELAQLAELEGVFERLYPDDASKREFGVSTALLRTYFVSSSRHTGSPAAQWCTLLEEIHGEVVVRLGQNMRKTKHVMNRLLVWRTAFLACEAPSKASPIGNDGGRTLGLAWMHGLVEYYKERLEKCIGELNIRPAEEEFDPTKTQPAGAAKRAVPALRASLPFDGEQLVTRCIASARTIASPQMSASPYFISAVSACREMVQVLQMVQGLLYLFSAHYIPRGATSSHDSSGAHRANSVELNFSDDYLATLRTPQWLFRFIFLFLGAMDLLQGPNRDAAARNGHQLDYAIHCIACLVGEVDGKRKDSDVKATLDALVLGHVKNSCLSQFPPQQTLELLASVRPSNGSVSTPSTPGGDAGASTDLVKRYGPLLREVLVRYPDFMAAIANFTHRNGVEEWGVSVMQAQLYCWDIATPPLPSPAAGGRVRYCLPGPSVASKPNEQDFASTILYSIAREVLRPLLSGLLSTSDPAVVSGDCGVSGAVNGTGADETMSCSEEAPLLCAAEQKLCALLLGVAGWLDSVSFPDAARMSRWNALDVGAQVMRESSMGRWCMGYVLQEVLQEVIGAAMQQLNSQHHDAPVAETGAQDDPPAALSVSVLRYLLRVERVWNALTEHTIELDSSAFDQMRSMDVKAMPKAATTVDFAASAADGNRGGTAARASYDTGLFSDFKFLFYDAVQFAMKAKWPKLYADLLTDPLLRSIHTYLIHAESAAQRGLGPRPSGAGVPPAAAAAGARGGPAHPGGGASGRHPGGAKRPPPPRHRDGEGGPARQPAEPDSVVLTAKEDFYGALRLVRCIVNRDHFIHRYTIAVRERLLMRPAPDVIADADLEKNKKRWELEAEQFLAAWLSDAALLKTVRELHSSYSPQTTTFNAAMTAEGGGTGFKLTSTILDWRLWGDTDAMTTSAADPTSSGAAPAALPSTVAELRATVAQTTATTASSDTAPLPFPNDVLPYLEQIEHRYNSDHSARMLRWDWYNHVFTTFTLAYPKESGRVTTVNGTLLLQRLFLAIAAYGRAGVELGTLAARAGLDGRRVIAVLKPCLDRDHLLVRVGGEVQGEEGTAPSSPPTSSPAAAAVAALPSMRLALNYDFTRPPNRPRGDFTYWPNVERRRFANRGADQDATVKKRRDIIKTSIMQVMKQVQRISHDELYATVREKNAKRFEVTVRNFKQEIEDLIGKDFMERAEGNPNEYVFRA